jgi:hypothetical protein
MGIRRTEPQPPPPPANRPRYQIVKLPIDWCTHSDKLSTGLTDFGDNNEIDRISDDELAEFVVVRRLRENQDFYSVSKEQEREGRCYSLSTRRWPPMLSIALRSLSQKTGEGHYRIPGVHSTGACALHCGLTRLRRNPIVDATDRAHARFRSHNTEIKGSIVSWIDESVRQFPMDLSLTDQPKKYVLKVPRELGDEVTTVSIRLGLNIDTIGLMSLALCLTTQAGVNRDHRADMKMVVEKFFDALGGRLTAYNGLMDLFGFEGGKGKVR